MSKKPLLFGTIASIIAINSVLADTTTSTVTSRDYVDAQDALKQDKITAGTTGNVVLYNGTQNGQTQFTERGIYDGADEYDETNDANKLITAGAVDASLPTGNAWNAVLYNQDGKIGGEMYIDASFPNSLFSGEWGDPDHPILITSQTLFDNTTETMSQDWNGEMYNGERLVTNGAVRRYAQEKKVCVGWLDNATHTDENCILWNLP